MPRSTPQSGHASSRPLRAGAKASALVGAALLVLLSAGSCSLGEGQGYVRGTLNAPDCWSGQFDLQPDFFAAVPYRNTLDLRIQNGGDYETFSDSVTLLIEDVTVIRPGEGQDAGPGAYGQDLRVSLPPAVVPPGVPVVADPNPARVHLTLSLQHTCRTQNVALYALDQVSLNANGNCDPVGGGEPVFSCSSGSTAVSTGSSDGGANADAPGISDGGADAGARGPDGGPLGGSVGRSTVRFQSLYDNVVDEPDAAKRLIQGDFKVYLGDPRDLCAGGGGPPPPCRGYLEGAFKFYFQRGRPAQPFP